MEAPTATIATSKLEPSIQYHLHVECTGLNATAWVGGGIDIGDFTVPAPTSTGTIDVDFSVGEETSGISLHSPVGGNDFCVWGHVILTTFSDWQAMQSLGIDWFSGDSYPVPTGKGLSYPLNYGTGGSASNVALLLNQGSSKAYPVLTVTGPFPNGVQVQWGGSALQYDGAIGAVPLILDSRSQTASMGGVDVSRNLSRRGFPTVPASGSVSLRLMSAGTGWVTAVCRDTYI